MSVTLSFTRAKLPHWLVADHAYFVTLRLHNTLPSAVLTEMAKERESLRKRFADDNQKRWQAMQCQFLRLDRILDACQDKSGWLIRPEVADVILGNLNWLEQARGWSIYAATLMSNHMHMVLRNNDGRNGELLKDLQQYKGFSGRMANQVLKRKGRFWAREDFDHWCRNQEGVERAMLYTILNPVKAGLVKRWDQWKWTRVRADMFRTGVVPG